MSIKIPESIGLVDFSNILSVNYHAAGPEQAGSLTLQQLAGIRGMCGHVIVCLDSKPYWRKQVFDGYKAGRKTDPELVAIWNQCIESVRDAGYNIAQAPTEEADDVIGTLARIYSQECACADVRLFTQDKDTLQCVDNHVRQFYPLLGKRDEFEIRGVEYVVKTYDGIEPCDLALLLAMAGDTSDKIPGIKQIGVGIGAKLIRAYRTKGNHQATMARIAEKCTAAVDEAQKMGENVPAYWRNYAAGMADLPKWLKLTTLNTNANLELDPLEYLQRVEPKPRAPEPDDERAAIETEGESADDPDWDRIAKEAEEFERKEMAAALPVGQAMDAALNGHVEATHDPSKMIIGKDPGADEFLRNAAKARELAKEPRVTAVGAQNLESAAQGWERKAALVANSASAAKPAVSGESPAPAQVVPPTQGPPKPKRGDAIRPPETTAITKTAPSWALAAQPRSCNEMLDVAAVLFNSGQFSQFGSFRGVYSVMSLGRELGMGYAESLQSFFIVNDQPFPKAKWILKRMQEHPSFEWAIIKQADDRSATIAAKHRSFEKPLEFTYTIEMAAAAGLTTGKNKWNWERIPRNMLRARAISMACGDWCPGAVFAMRSWEEAQDE